MVCISISSMISTSSNIKVRLGLSGTKNPNLTKVMYNLNTLRWWYYLGWALFGVAGRISNDKWGGDAQWRDSRQMLLQLPTRTLAVQL
ncbi:hypothetical protein C5167_015133 [Papaver somniferum]|uniref:Uncharacterized protein n=1 Tax=Papaver somniferum TaxID=3469 RepID=A0A4Y7J986_PAPSO|nr:hypothetical protein C5167_015133 [Papaver somniferum]